MRDAVIVGAVRTALGKRNGALAAVHPADLSARILQALVERVGVDPELVDDVVWGCVSQVGEQTFDIARTAVLSAGWPEHVPGTTIDRQCGSSQQAVHFAAASVIAGHYELAVAGGVESMSRVPMGSAGGTGNPLGLLYQERYGSEFPNQGIGAEAIAREFGLSRQRLDEFALESHDRAAAAQDDGAFEQEIVGIDTPDGRVSADQGIRRGGTLETLGAVRSAFSDEGVVTAANASQISDGSAALLITTSARAAELGLRPLARVHTAVVTGAPPTPMLTGPIPATEKALRAAGLRMADIGAYECNEAFACVPLAWASAVGADEKRLNPNGGAIALGHPLGASGARLMTTLVHHMQRQDVRYGLQTMCEGGGQANATILELLR